VFHVKQSTTFKLPLATDTHLSVARCSPARKTASPHQIIAVEDSLSFGHLYRLDGNAMAAEADEFMLHESLAHIPALNHPAPTSALILGGGDGASARELLKHPSLTRILIAELDPEVVRVISDEIPTMPAGTFANPRVTLRIGDAAETLDAAQQAGERFDLILFDLTEPDNPACAHLHGNEFLHLCAASLTPQGMIHVQLGSPFYQPRKTAALHQRLRTVFPSVRTSLISVPLYGGPWLLACASAPGVQDGSEANLASRLDERRITGLRYYNPAVHHAGQALPNYIRQLLA
jgi:spermidine synthase